VRVIFMGTPAFALPTLEALIGSRHDVVAVYTQPPRPAGRGQKLTPSPIHQRAESAGIPVHTPESLKDAEAQKQFAEIQADVAVVAAYGLLLPQAILDAPRLGCINVHPSALPRWRGAAPIQRTLMAGDRTSACCIMQMEAGLDTGPVLLREPVTITEEVDAGALQDQMASWGAKLVLRALEGMATGPLRGTSQATEGVTYAAKITKDDQRVDWNLPAHVIHNQVRGLSPLPGAVCMLDGEMVKLYRVQTVAQPHHATPGAWVSNTRGIIACGSGTALQLMELQRAGGKRMGFSEFARGKKA
jgi:methionyl-tRNA formyltransferase